MDVQFKSFSSIASLLKSVQTLRICNLYEGREVVTDCGTDIRVVNPTQRLLVRRSLGEPSRARTTVGFWRQPESLRNHASTETLHIEKIRLQNGSNKPKRITSANVNQTPRRNSWNQDKLVRRSSFTLKESNPETSQGVASHEFTRSRRVSVLNLKSTRKVKRAPGTLKLDISVAHINFKPDPNEDWSRDCQSHVSQFYDKILSNKDLYIHAFSSMPLLKQNCVVEDLRLGSLHLIVRVLSVESMDTLSRAVQSGELCGLFNRTLVSQHVMKDLGLSDLVLQVKMKEVEAKKVRDELISVHAMRSSTRRGSVVRIIRPKTSLGICRPGEDGQVNDDINSRFFCTRTLKNIVEKSTMEAKMLIKRIEVLYASLDDFLMTLKLAKPRALNEFTNMSQVMKIYTFLLKSPSVGKNVRTDLVREFVDIVEAMRSLVTQQSQGMRSLAKDLVVYVHVEELLVAKKLRENVMMMYGESFVFPSSWDLPKVKLSPMDDPIFRRLVAFLPEIMKKLEETINNVLHIRKLIKIQN